MKSMKQGGRILHEPFSVMYLLGSINPNGEGEVMQLHDKVLCIYWVKLTLMMQENDSAHMENRKNVFHISLYFLVIKKVLDESAPPPAIKQHPKAPYLYHD